jgi:hypothetical protein
MLACMRVALIAGFVAAAGSWEVYASDAEPSNIRSAIDRETVGQGAGAFNLWPLVWKIIEHEAGLYYDDFVRRFCLDDKYRNDILDTVTKGPDWLPGWLVPPPVIDRSTLENGIKTIVHCDSHMLTRFYVIQNKTTELIRIIEGDEKTPGISKRIDDLHRKVEDLQKSIEGDVKVRGVKGDIGQLLDVTGRDEKSGLRGDIAGLKDIIGRDEKSGLTRKVAVLEQELVKRLPKLVPTPRYAHRRHHLTPCVCKTLASEDADWLKAWRSGSPQ